MNVCVICYYFISRHICNLQYDTKKSLLFSALVAFKFYFYYYFFSFLFLFLFFYPSTLFCVYCCRCCCCFTKLFRKCRFFHFNTHTQNWKAKWNRYTDRRVVERQFFRGRGTTRSRQHWIWKKQNLLKTNIMLHLYFSWIANET